MASAQRRARSVLAMMMGPCAQVAGIARKWSLELTYKLMGVRWLRAASL